MQALSVTEKRIIILRAVMLANHARRLVQRAKFLDAATLRRRALALLKQIPGVSHRAAASFLAFSYVRHTVAFQTSEVTRA